MTPDELIDELNRLALAHCYREAVDLSIRTVPEIRSQMTTEHAIRLHEIMHYADTALDLEEVAQAREQADADARASRSA